MPKELFIDVSEYEPPQPFEEVMQLLMKMKTGEYIRMLHRKKPLPLLQILQDNGLNYKTRQIKTISQKTISKKTISQEALINNSILWEIVIWKKNDLSVDNFCSKNF